MLIVNNSDTDVRVFSKSEAPEGVDLKPTRGSNDTVDLIPAKSRLFITLITLVNDLSIT